MFRETIKQNLIQSNFLILWYFLTIPLSFFNFLRHTTDTPVLSLLYIYEVSRSHAWIGLDLL